MLASCVVYPDGSIAPAVYSMPYLGGSVYGTSGSYGGGFFPVYGGGGYWNNRWGGGWGGYGTGCRTVNVYRGGGGNVYRGGGGCGNVNVYRGGGNYHR